jgi:hypothetical protein
MKSKLFVRNHICLDTYIELLRCALCWLGKNLRRHHARLLRLQNRDDLLFAQPKLIERRGDHLGTIEYADPFAEAYCTSLASACIIGSETPPNQARRG